jgi:hypothetical protein
MKKREERTKRRVEISGRGNFREIVKRTGINMSKEL